MIPAGAFDYHIPAADGWWQPEESDTCRVQCKATSKAENVGCRFRTDFGPRLRRPSRNRFLLCSLTDKSVYLATDTEKKREARSGGDAVDRKKRVRSFDDVPSASVS